MDIAKLNINDETILDSLSTICLTEELADVHFRFPKEGVSSIPGHKMILSLRSPVFKVMFYGTFPQEEGDVKILDIQANTFKMLIRYIYTDKVVISGSSVTSLLYAAQKYQLVPLLSKCEAYLSKQLSANNACTIYTQAKFFSMHQLQAAALNFIAGKADDVFGNDDFLTFSPEDLTDILKLDHLCINEITIFKSILKWTDARIMKSNNTVNGKSRRDILSEHNILYMIGIPLVSLNDYTETVLPSGVLTDEEQLHIFKVITIKDTATDVNKFRMKPRKSTVTILVQKIIPSAVHIEDNIHDTHNRRSVKIRQRAIKKQSGRVGHGEVMHLRPNSDIKVMSVNIKPRFQDWPAHARNIPETTVNCTFAGQIFRGVYRYAQGLKLEINQEVPSGEIVKINFSFEADGRLNGIHQHMVERVQENYETRYCMSSIVPRDEYIRGPSYNQQNFSYTYNWADGMYIDFEFSGVHLVDSVEICRL